jgi:hypothetical protein
MKVIEKTAYLVVRCDENTHALLGAYVWSSPPWDQSILPKGRWYVVYYLKRQTYQEAFDSIMHYVDSKHSPLNYLKDFMDRAY